MSAAIAQSVERILGKDEVTGSNPVSSSKAPKAVVFGALLFNYSLFTLHSTCLKKRIDLVKGVLILADKTNAMRQLDRLRINYKIHDYTNTDAISGTEIAIVLKEDPDKVFKTLVTVGKSGTNYVFMVPVEKELDLKKAAKNAKEKSIEMIKSKELLPLTGYIHGGCSPIGMKKQFKTFIDSTALNFENIYFSGGKIGLQIETSLENLQKIVPVITADIIVE